MLLGWEHQIQQQVSHPFSGVPQAYDLHLDTTADLLPWLVDMLLYLLPNIYYLLHRSFYLKNH